MEVPEIARQRESTINLPAEVENRMTVTNNLAMEIVVTTRDKISVALHEALPRFKASYAWTAPASIASTVWIAVLTSDFNDAFGLTAQAVEGGFVVIGLGSVAWLAVSLYKRCKSAYQHKHVVDAIVNTHDGSTPPTVQGFVVPDNP